MSEGEQYQMTLDAAASYATERGMVLALTLHATQEQRGEARDAINNYRRMDRTKHDFTNAYQGLKDAVTEHHAASLALAKARTRVSDAERCRSSQEKKYTEAINERREIISFFGDYHERWRTLPVGRYGQQLREDECGNSCRDYFRDVGALGADSGAYGTGSGGGAGEKPVVASVQENEGGPR